MAKPKQLINTQNLALKQSNKKNNISWDWSATFYNFASFTIMY